MGGVVVNTEVVYRIVFTSPNGLSATVGSYACFHSP